MPGGQYGEDRILKLFFRNQPTGFLVDVGAANGFDNSNSYMLLKKAPGWVGLLIEPEPSQFAELQKLYQDNQKAILLNCGVGTGGKGILYCGGQVSTFKPDVRDRCVEVYGIDYKEVEVPMRSLTAILADMNAPKEIDFMSIDCEGMDYDVWQTLDTKMFSPRLVCIEGSGYAMHGYVEFCRTVGNTFYLREDIACSL